MPRYIVTGCAGFIGSHLTDALLSAGHEVLGIDSFTDYYPRAAKEHNLAAARLQPSFSLAESDLAGDLSWKPLLRDVDGIFHLAAQPGVRGSWGASFDTYLRDNVLATQRLLEAAVEARVRVVVASTSSIYGNPPSHPTPEDTPPSPLSPYGVTKLACEHLVGSYAESFGLEAARLRYFTVYGPRQRPDMAFSRIVAALAADRPFELFGSGRQSRDFTYVADAVAATVAAMERAPAGVVYNVGGGSEATLLDVIAMCERLSGRRLEVRRGVRAPGDVRRTTADTSRIRRDLDWRPRTSLAEGFAAQLGDHALRPLASTG